MVVFWPLTRFSIDLTKSIYLIKTSLSGLANYVKAHNQKTRLKAVYFSASSAVLADILPTLEDVWKTEFDGLIAILTRNDLRPFVEEANCMGVEHSDVLDTAEMEMCYRSAAFLRAQYSIWSRTIDFERRATHARTLADKLFTEIIKWLLIRNAMPVPILFDTSRISLFVWWNSCIHRNHFTL